MTDNPLNMDENEIAMWLSGGADVGSVKHEQARSALALHIAKVQADAVAGSRKWAQVSAIAASISALAAVVAILVAVL